MIFYLMNSMSARVQITLIFFLLSCFDVVFRFSLFLCLFSYPLTLLFSFVYVSVVVLYFIHSPYEFVHAMHFVHLFYQFYILSYPSFNEWCITPRGRLLWLYFCCSKRSFSSLSVICWTRFLFISAVSLVINLRLTACYTPSSVLFIQMHFSVSD